jgi:hypothetical protein
MLPEHPFGHWPIVRSVGFRYRGEHSDRPFSSIDQVDSSLIGLNLDCRTCP